MLKLTGVFSISGNNYYRVIRDLLDNGHSLHDGKYCEVCQCYHCPACEYPLDSIPIKFYGQSRCWECNAVLVFHNVGKNGEYSHFFNEYYKKENYPNDFLSDINFDSELGSEILCWNCGKKFIKFRERKPFQFTCKSCIKKTIINYWKFIPGENQPTKSKNLKEFLSNE